MLSFGLPLASFVLCLAQAAAPPAQPQKRRPSTPASPPLTTFDTVLAGKQTIGRNVELSAILLPPSAIQTTTRGQKRHFVLAVKKTSTYFQGLEVLARELREQGIEKARALGAAARDDTRFPTLLAEVGALLDRAEGKGVPLLARVPATEAIVVEVFGLESLGKAFDWETVLGTGPDARPVDAKKPPGTLPTAPDTWMEAATRRDLANQSLLFPPDIATALPELPHNAHFDSDREVESFNVAIDQYNSELRRRRLYLAQRTEEDVRFHLERLERFLALEEQPLAATVTTRVDVAADTYARIHGAAPSVYLKERARGEAAFVRRSFRTASLLVTSFPAGARVARAGADIGATPLVVRDAAVGSRPHLSLALPGYHEKTLDDVVVANPMGVIRLDSVLSAEAAALPRKMTEAEASLLFSARFRPQAKFVLAVFSSSEQPGFKGKKDKDATKHAEAMRKAAMGDDFFELSVSSDRADVTLEIAPIDGDQARDAKDLHAFKTTYRSETDPESYSETLSLKDEKAKPSRVLARISERLKQREWKRALGAE